jgi:hypothetical protein
MRSSTDSNPETSFESAMYWLSFSPAATEHPVMLDQ